MSHTCMVGECKDKIKSAHMCNKHYLRYRKYGDPEYVKFPDRDCSVENCDDKAKKKGMCKLHYQRMARTGKTTTNDSRFRGNTLDRFWHYTEKQENECWIWTGPTTHNGKPNNPYYGILWVSEINDFVRAHIWSHTNFKFKIDENLEHDHICGISLCVNPNHIEAVTQRINKQRQQFNSMNVAIKNGKTINLKLRS